MKENSHPFKQARGKTGHSSSSSFDPMGPPNWSPKLDLLRQEPVGPGPGASSLHRTKGRTVTEAMSGFPVHARRRGKRCWCVKGLEVAEKAGASLQPAGSYSSRPLLGPETAAEDQGGQAAGRRAGGKTEPPASQRGVAPSRTQSRLLTCERFGQGLRGPSSAAQQPLLHVYGMSATSTFPPPPITGEVTLLCYHLGGGLRSTAVTLEAPLWLRFAQRQTVCSPAKSS